MNSTNRSYNNLQSNQEQMLSAKYENLKQYQNKKINRKNVKLLFSQKSVLFQIRPRIQSKTRVIANLHEYEKPQKVTIL